MCFAGGLQRYSNEPWQPDLIQVPSPNHNERPLKTLTDPTRQVSAHYLIGRDGTLYQLVDENRRAWQAGQSHAIPHNS